MNFEAFLEYARIHSDIVRALIAIAVLLAGWLAARVVSGFIEEKIERWWIGPGSKNIKVKISKVFLITQFRRLIYFSMLACMLLAYFQILQIHFF